MIEEKLKNLLKRDFLMRQRNAAKEKYGNAAIRQCGNRLCRVAVLVLPNCRIRQKNCGNHKNKCGNSGKKIAVFFKNPVFYRVFECGKCGNSGKF